MKNLITIILCAISLYLNAQPPDSTKTLFGNKKPHIGYFISPSCQFANIAGSNAILPGIGGGIIINNNLFLGLNYKFNATENTAVGENDSTLYLDQKLYGVKCEYSAWSEKVVHVNFLLEAGIGEIELDLKDSYESAPTTVPENDVWYAYLEPVLTCEINVWKNVKFNLSAGYRMISDVTFRSISERNLVGFNCTLGVKIGIF